MAKCKKCKGTGEWERIDKNLVCPDCNGKGVVGINPKEQEVKEENANRLVDKIGYKPFRRLRN